MKSAIFIIILFLPLVLAAHEEEVHLAVDPTSLPGGRGYLREIIVEWIDVNLLTLSTKNKQKKKLNLAEERVAEIVALFEKKELDRQALKLGLQRYKYFLSASREMAEKIIVLNGVEIALAGEFERDTRIFEEVFSQLLRTAHKEDQVLVLDGLIASRVQNQGMFEFMVRNYQATNEDIKKHQEILEEHLELIERLSRNFDAEVDTAESRKFQKAGLNMEAYQHIEKAKNIVYSLLLQ